MHACVCLPLPLNPLGDHRAAAACAWSGVLRNRGCPLERGARVCREEGTCVCKTLVRNLNVALARSDDRHIEVIARAEWSAACGRHDNCVAAFGSGVPLLCRRRGHVTRPCAPAPLPSISQCSCRLALPVWQPPPAGAPFPHFVRRARAGARFGYRVATPAVEDTVCAVFQSAGQRFPSLLALSLAGSHGEGLAGSATAHSTLGLRYTNGLLGC